MIQQKVIESKETDFSYWETVWKNTKIPQEIKPSQIAQIHGILNTVLPSGGLRCIEIGCAIGSWLAYFNRGFGYQVDGIEYAPDAAEKTIENMEALGILANIREADFFEFEPEEPYDVVFSGGFIEHFEDLNSVMKRLVGMATPDGGYIVTIIPCMEGINRWISKTFRPEVAAIHFPVNKKELIGAHEEHGVDTLYAGYIGPFHLLPPIKGNRFAYEHKRLSDFVNMPFHIWNKATSMLSNSLKVYPPCRVAYQSILYVGRRKKHGC